jgi:hypothetical protein
MFFQLCPDGKAEESSACGARSISVPPRSGSAFSRSLPESGKEIL